MSGSRIKRPISEQTVLSSYFSPGSSPNKRRKHDSDVVDLTVSSSEEERGSNPVSQRTKQNKPGTPKRRISSHKNSSPPSPSHKLEKYRLDYPVALTRTNSPEGTSRREAYREAFRRKLMGDGISSDKTIDPKTPSPEASAEVSDSELQDSSRGSGNRQRIQRLGSAYAYGQAMLSKPRDDVGPSGQSYTALEQQVSPGRKKFSFVGPQLTKLT